VGRGRQQDDHGIGGPGERSPNAGPQSLAVLRIHIRGKTFNARGMGVAGSPVILIGFTDRVAWGMTALGADQADLFLPRNRP
jgi:acyl-homoserine lactone acylase PvdQ